MPSQLTYPDDTATGATGQTDNHETHNDSESPTQTCGNPPIAAYPLVGTEDSTVASSTPGSSSQATAEAIAPAAPSPETTKRNFDTMMNAGNDNNDVNISNQSELLSSSSWKADANKNDTNTTTTSSTTSSTTTKPPKSKRGRKSKRTISTDSHAYVPLTQTFPIPILPKFPFPPPPLTLAPIQHTTASNSKTTAITNNTFQTSTMTFVPNHPYPVFVHPQTPPPDGSGSGSGGGGANQKQPLTKQTPMTAPLSPFSKGLQYMMRGRRYNPNLLRTVGETSADKTTATTCNNNNNNNSNKKELPPWQITERTFGKGKATRTADMDKLERMLHALTRSDAERAAGIIVALLGKKRNLMLRRMVLETLPPIKEDDEYLYLDSTIAVDYKDRSNDDNNDDDDVNNDDGHVVVDDDDAGGDGDGDGGDGTTDMDTTTRRGGTITALSIGTSVFWKNRKECALIAEGVREFLQHHADTKGTRPRDVQHGVDAVSTAAVFAMDSSDIPKTRIAQCLGTTWRTIDKACERAANMKETGALFRPMERKARSDRMVDIVKLYVDEFCHDDAYSKRDTRRSKGYKVQRIINVGGDDQEEEISVENHPARLWYVAGLQWRYDQFVNSPIFERYQQEYPGKGISMTVFRNCTCKCVRDPKPPPPAPSQPFMEK